MRTALEQARLAAKAGEVPVGAVLVDAAGEPLACGHNQSIGLCDPSAHAEMEAIRQAARNLGRGNLAGCTLYSSTRACPMCEAACYWAGIGEMIHGRSASNASRPTLCW